MLKIININKELKHKEKQIHFSAKNHKHKKKKFIGP